MRYLIASLCSALVVAFSAGAAAQQANPWIDVVTIPGYVIDSIQYGKTEDGGSDAWRQIIRGRVNGTQAFFAVTFQPCVSKDHQGLTSRFDCSPDLIKQKTWSMRNLAKTLKVDAASDHVKIDTGNILGARLDFRSRECRAAAVGVGPPRNGTTFPMLVEAFACGPSVPALTEYISRITRIDAAIPMIAVTKQAEQTLDPTKPWIDVDAVPAFVPDPNGVGRGADAYTQEIKGTVGGATLHLVVRDLPCTKKRAPDRVACYVADIKNDDLGRRFGQVDRSTRKTFQVDDRYGIHFTFQRNGQTCRGAYVGIGKNALTNAYPMVVEASLCDGDGGVLDAYARQIRPIVSRKFVPTR